MIDDFIFNKRLGDVYDCEGYTTAEVLSYFYKKINDFVERFNELEGTTQERLDYLLGEGLSIEVAKKINELYENGMLSQIINNQIFGELNDKIDSFGIIPTKMPSDADYTRALQNILDTHGDNCTIYIPKNTIVNFSEITVTHKNVTFYGNGTIKGVIKIDSSEFSTNFRLLDLKVEDTGSLKFVTCRNGLVQNVQFTNTDKSIEFAPKDGLGATQPIARINICNNQFENVNFDIYHRMTTNGHQMNVADIHFTNNMCKYAKESHIDMDACDGLSVQDNTFFMSSGHNAFHHVIVRKWCNWTRIINNAMFEAHEESIYLKNPQNFNIGHNEFAWCGQNKLCGTIKIEGSEEFYNLLGKIKDNNIALPSQCGVLIKDCDYVDITGNTIHLDKNNSHYKGDEPINDSMFKGVYFNNRTNKKLNCKVNNFINMPNIYQYNMEEYTLLRNVDKKYIELTEQVTELNSDYDIIEVYETQNSPITSISDNQKGKEVTVVVRSGKTIKFESNNKIILKNNQNFTFSGGETVTFILLSNGVWYEKSRTLYGGKALTLRDNSTTLNVAYTNVIALAYTSETTVDTISEGYSGQEITLIFYSDKITLKHTTSIRLKGEINIKVPRNCTMKFVYYGGSWWETSRSF